jgi:hypothetical protein
MARKRSTSPAEEPAAELLPAQPTAIEVAPAMLTRHDLVDPTVPAGMVRISDGSQERFIWPVHLSGWQQQGWTLIAAATGVQITPQPTAPAAVIEVQLAEETPEPSSSQSALRPGRLPVGSWRAAPRARRCCSTTRCCDW